VLLNLLALPPLIMLPSSLALPSLLPTSLVLQLHRCHLCWCCARAAAFSGAVIFAGTTLFAISLSHCHLCCCCHCTTAAFAVAVRCTNAALQALPNLLALPSVHMLLPLRMLPPFLPPLLVLLLHCCHLCWLCYACGAAFARAAVC
jgi:hypothetical protein